MRTMIGALALLALAGCSAQTGNEQASAAPANGSGAAPMATSPSAPGGEIVRMQAGEWEITVDMGGGVRLPATRTCLTQADVDRGTAAMMSGGGSRNGVNCDYSNVTMSGGRIQGTSTCTGPGMEMSMTMDGSMTPTAYDVNQTIRTTVRGQSRESAGHMTGRRIGECAPGQVRS